MRTAVKESALRYSLHRRATVRSVVYFRPLWLMWLEYQVDLPKRSVKFSRPAWQAPCLSDAAAAHDRFKREYRARGSQQRWTVIGRSVQEVR